jgi:hypothetical protein
MKMSAYICNPEHFVALGLFASARVSKYAGGGHLRVDPRYVEGLTDIVTNGQAELATIYADILYQENIKSVLACYPNDTLQSAPGLCEKPAHIKVSNRDVVDSRYTVKPIDVLSMCNCLEYQSCETDEYRQSVAWHLTQAIRAAAVRDLPGYDEAIRDFSLAA